MALDARFGHVNLIARNWRALVDFYVDVFGCEPLRPERDLSGDWVDAGTGVPGARLRGMHLRLPGQGEAGATLEVFEYDTGTQGEGADPEPPRLPRVDRPGFGHICFSVPDVEAAQAVVLARGGRAIGEVVTAPIEGAGLITWCYVTDPEGNAIELQRWSR